MHGCSMSGPECTAIPRCRAPTIFFREGKRGGVPVSKDGSIWQLFVLCLLAPSAIFYYSLGHPWKGKTCQMVFCPCQHFRGHKKSKKKKEPFKTRLKTQFCQIDPCFCPPHRGGGSQTGGFPCFFWGKVLIVLNSSRRRQGPKEQIGTIPKKRESPKQDKKGQISRFPPPPSTGP